MIPAGAATQLAAAAISALSLIVIVQTLAVLVLGSTVFEEVVDLSPPTAVAAAVGPGLIGVGAARLARAPSLLALDAGLPGDGA
jgi:hypothetical protein